MSTRELYEKKYKAQLEEWGGKLTVFKARAKMATAQGRIDLQPSLDAIQTHFDQAKARLSELAESGEDKWHDLSEKLETGWNDLKAAAEGAVDALRKSADED